MFIFKRLERKLDNITRLLAKKENNAGRLESELKALKDELTELEARVSAIEEALMVLLSKKDVSEDEESEKKDRTDPKDIVNVWRNGEGDERWMGLP